MVSLGWTKDGQTQGDVSTPSTKMGLTIATGESELRFAMGIRRKVFPLYLKSSARTQQPWSKHLAN